MNTDSIIKTAFKSAKMPNNDRVKYLYKKLSDDLKKELIKHNKKYKEMILSELVMEGVSLKISNYTICSADECGDYNGEKLFVAEYPYRKRVGFNTITGAIKHIEKHY